MSTYHYQWLSYTANQQQAACMLAGLGLLLLLGWLLLGQLLPKKWVQAGQWAYLAACFTLGALLVLGVKG